VLQLTQVNEKLSEYSRMQANAASPTVIHTLQRHWDILQDYSHEFCKIRTNVCAVREREELLQEVDRDRFVHVENSKLEIDSVEISSDLSRVHIYYLSDNNKIENYSVGADSVSWILC